MYKSDTDRQMEVNERKKCKTEETDKDYDNETERSQ